tara:strand:+ start:832 stop:1071 length:240 start_codon:yes stop_codon:yes gene_type:complete
MSKWTDFLDGIERKDDLVSLIEEISNELSLVKPRTLSEETRLTNIETVLAEAKLKARELEHKNNVLNNKIAILEEDIDL